METKRKMKNKTILLTIILFLPFGKYWGGVCFAQNKKVDSLLSVYNNKSQADTSRLKALDKIASFYFYDNPDSSMLFSNMLLNLSQETKNKHYEAVALNKIGNEFQNQGNYPKALEYIFKSIKVNEQIKDNEGVANNYNSLGNIYIVQGNIQKALEYYNLAINRYTQIRSKTVGVAYLNIGMAYLQKGDNESGLGNFMKAENIFKESGDKPREADALNNIGNYYYQIKDFNSALDYYLKSLRISKELDDVMGVGICFANSGLVYSELGNYRLAIIYSDSSLIIAKEIGDIELQMNVYSGLADISLKTKNYKGAYENKMLYQALSDSVFNADKNKQLGDIKTKFEVDKKEAELKLKSQAEQDKLKAVSSEEKKTQQIIIYSVAGVLIIVIVFSIFLLKRFKVTQRQKHIIEIQKDEVARQKAIVDESYKLLHEKNKEVMDSINYASRIQKALLPSEKYIENSLSRLKNTIK
jgi:tetratricopeptide (TPR) repeat protein